MIMSDEIFNLTSIQMMKTKYYTMNKNKNKYKEQKEKQQSSVYVKPYVEQ